ncbi:meiosis regulator and mRNA stability factor 1-like isoform X2 [Stegodyphus dumicola]|uniref:meiosis regulator and mRNA stability factor 1-like isoform X2 n=1 Tax=Stegodyphus dumicola TaxID=202533 RepID=UPI0015AC4FBB|nr:meiosis regulator and mRNA stability factor 1-like isoform X2 [Stegodyphus dumicola]
MRDVVTIQGDSGSRVIKLNTGYCKTPSLSESEDSQEFNVIERPYCERHFRVSSSEGWAEQYSICPLPLVYMSLKTLATAVHTLLDSHQGTLPLISFCDCYEAEIGPLSVVDTFENMTKDEIPHLDPTAHDNPIPRSPKGVPLEHLIACVTGVEVAKSVLCIKKVQWLENKAPDFQGIRNINPALAGPLTLFGREVMDLLKSQPQCLVPFSKFIPTYHHHFGRQCRVADYGFTKLIDLLEAVPHIVQVLGEGQNRQVTLTHRTQVKRFAAELLRILKSRASKQITVSEFPQAYEQVIEKPFEIINYGVCEIEDMLDEVPDNIIVTCISGNEIIIGIPKREQTAEEIERTKQFAAEVVELMKHTPHCSMAFNKFIPAYHHHFGKQCRVADYGFTKLIELFEAIPNVLEVKGTGEDKILNLIPKEQHKILTDRFVSLLKSQPQEVIDINEINSTYARMFGHALRPVDFGFTDLYELLEKMNSTIRIISNHNKTYVNLINWSTINKVSLNLRHLLMEQTDGKLPIKEMLKLYQARFCQRINLSIYVQDLRNVIIVEDGIVMLTPLHLLARNLIVLLKAHEGQMPLSNLGSLFQQRFGISLSAANYGFSNMYSLFENLAEYFIVKGKKQKRIVYLNSDSIDVNFDISSLDDKCYESKSDTDILSQPVPSCVPSPYLEPVIKENLEDLMGFETPPSNDFDVSSSCNVSDFKNSCDKQYAVKVASEIPPFSAGKQMQADTSSSVSHTSSFLNMHTAQAKYFNPRSHLSLNAQLSSYAFKQPSTIIHEPTVAHIQSVIEYSDASVSKTVLHYSSGSESKIASTASTCKLSTLRSEKRFESRNLICQKVLSDQSINKSKLDSHSFEDLTKCRQQLQETINNDLPSSKSTPTRSSRQLNRRNRIAALFSLPIID